MRRVQINFVPHSQQIPAHLFTLLHGQTREIAEDIAVDGVKHSGRLASHFIEDHERGNELAIHIFWRSIRIGFAFRGNNDRPQQSGVRLKAWVHMGVVPPNDRAWLPRPGTAGFCGKPAIREFTSGSDPITFAERKVERTFAVLVITQPMRMHVVWLAGAVRKRDVDFIANFGTNHRPENPQPLRLRLFRGERIVGVFDEARLRPFELCVPGTRNRQCAQQVHAAGRIIPRNIFSSDVVVASDGERRLKPYEDEAESNCATHSHGSHYPISGIFCNPRCWNNDFGEMPVRVKPRPSQT